MDLKIITPLLGQKKERDDKVFGFTRVSRVSLFGSGGIACLFLCNAQTCVPSSVLGEKERNKTLLPMDNS